MKVSWISNAFEPHKREEVVCDVTPGKRFPLIDALPGVEYVNPMLARVWRNGHEVTEPFDESLSVVAAPTDWFIVMRCPAYPAGMPFIAKFFFSIAIAMIAGGVSKLLQRPPEQSDDRDDTGPTYGFSGMTAQRAEGRPRQVIYGVIRSAGTIIGETIDNGHNSTGTSVYRAQIAFGEGPIHAISGITEDTDDDSSLTNSIPGREVPTSVQIQGNPASEIRGVTAHVRLGTLEQTHAPTYDNTETRTALSTPLEAPQTAIDDPSTPLIRLGETSQGDQDALLDEYAASTDLTVDADSVRVTLRFTSGYFRTVGAATAGRWWSAFIRIIELDGGGLPIAVGGDFSDGWVRHEMPRTQLRSTSPFSLEYQLPLYDPVGYTPAPVGQALLSANTAAVTEHVVSSPSLPGGWASATSMPSHTVSLWMAIVDISTPTGEQPEFFRHGEAPVSGSRLRGIVMRVNYRQYTSAPGYTIYRYVPEYGLCSASGVEWFYEGRGKAYHTPSFAFPDDDDQEVHHLEVTYSDDVGDGTGRSRVRMYVDGAMLWEFVELIDAAFPTSDPIYVATHTEFSAGRKTLPLRVDELWYYGKERSADEVFGDYNEGRGVYGSVTASGEDYATLEDAWMVCGYHFDEGAGVYTAQDFSSRNNDLTVDGSSSINGKWIVAGRATDNTIKRGKYRIQVMRNIADSTNVNNFDDNVELEAVGAIVDRKFSYPGTPQLAISVEAEEQLGTSVPGITAVVSGRLLPEWDGANATNPTFVERFSRSPAWACADRLINQRYGLGQFFGNRQIDVVSFRAWAEYCAEPLYSLRGDYATGKTLTPVSSGYYDLHYASDPNPTTLPQFTGRGRITFKIPANDLPITWVVGEYVAWVGEYTPGGSYVDFNYLHTEGGGYEVESIIWNGTDWSIDCYWDRLLEGNPWADGTYLSADAGFPVSGNYNGTMEGRIARHLYDATHDVSEGDWDSLQAMASTAQGVIVMEGNRVRVRVNRPRDPVGIISMGNIIEDSFEIDYGGQAERENAYTIEFLDADANWERRPAYVEHESVQSAGDLDELRHESVFVRGLTRRAAAIRYGHYLLNVNHLLDRMGRFRAAVDSVHYEVGDVLILQHDVCAWGQGGRVYADSSSTTQLDIDREVVLEAATTYYVDVQNPISGLFKTVQVSTVAGTYEKGSTLTLSSALTFRPTGGAPYVVYSVAERMLIEVVEISLSNKLEVAVSWVEYDEDVYADVTNDIDTLTTTNNGSGNGRSDTRLQVDPELSEFASRVIVGEGGNDEVEISASWRVWAGSHDRGTRVALWSRDATDLENGFTEDDVWTSRAEVPVSTGSATFVIPEGRVGRVYEVALQVIAPGGQRRGPSNVPSQRVYIGSNAFRARKPSAFVATLEGGKAIYRIRPADDATMCTHEIRRGGWLLGQVVAVLPPGQIETPLLDDWASGAENAAGRSAPTLYCRARTPSGRYSRNAEVLVFDPEPSFGMEIREDAGTLEFFSDQSWEDWGTGWWNGGTSPDTVLTGLQVNTDPLPDDLPSASWVSFDGSATSGTFETAGSWAVPTDLVWKPEQYHVEFFVEAYQVHPGAFAHSEGAMNDWTSERITAEGPLETLPGEPVNCSMTVEIRMVETPDGVWSDWQMFTPGVYYGAMFQFRLTFYRPNTDYNFVMHRAHQRFRRVNRVKWERSPASRVLSQESLL